MLVPSLTSQGLDPMIYKLEANYYTIDGGPHQNLKYIFNICLPLILQQCWIPHHPHLFHDRIGMNDKNLQSH